MRAAASERSESGKTCYIPLRADTLLIRDTGRTDFQNGDPAAQYDSLSGKLLTLPEETPGLPGP